jgi:hypothetical protein
MAAEKFMREKGHGSYEEIREEKEFLQLTTKTKRVVCHFFHEDFTRCRIVDKHLALCILYFLVNYENFK